MTYRIALSAAWTAVLSISAAVALTFTPASQAFAASPPANPAAAQKSGPATEAAKPQGPPSHLPQSDRNQVTLLFSPWTKYCASGLAAKSSEITAEEVCFTASDGHLASGEKIVIALLIEPKGSDKKILRVTLPLGVALIPGARIVIDQKEAMTAPYEVCLPRNGCMADYKADAALIGKLKNGRTLAIQAFDKGRPISFTLPLTGFAKAFDGPASDPAGLNGQRENLPNGRPRAAGDHLRTPGGK